jgi:hypothetical protein
MSDPDFEGEDHECDDKYEPDCDLCSSCKEHSGFCSECHMSNCCGYAPYMH